MEQVMYALHVCKAMSWLVDHVRYVLMFHAALAAAQAPHQFAHNAFLDFISMLEIVSLVLMDV